MRHIRLSTAIAITVAAIVAASAFVALEARAAQTAAQPVNGGTGTNSIPSYGQVLVGNSGGTYTPTATSSLGLTAGAGGTKGQLQYNSNGALAGISTTTASCAGNASCSAFTIIGTSPVTITGSGGGSTFGYPFVVTSYGGSTSTVLALLSGLISNGSTTISSLGSGLVGANNGLLYGFASSSLFGYIPLNPTRTINTTAPLQGGGDLSADRTFSITQAGSGANGYLSSTDWNTFNNKQATISTSFPITLAGATVGFNGLSTSTAAVLGNIPYFSGANTFANVATTSASCSGTVSCSAFTIIGASPITISGAGAAGSGLGSSTPWTPGFVTYVQSNSNLAAVATGTLSISSPLTGGPFTIIGTGGSVGCQTASGSQTGCLSSTDWNTFNNKSGFGYLFPSNATTTLLSFSGGASTTQLSVFSRAYFGGSATTTIDSSGNVVVPSGSHLTNTGTTDGCATWSSGQLNSTGSACGGGGGGAYPFPGANNSTSTLTQFNGGLTAYATSTIGDGTNGLTINGNASTTGFAKISTGSTGSVDIGGMGSLIFPANDAFVGRTDGTGVFPFNNGGSLVLGSRQSATTGRGSIYFYSGTGSLNATLNESGNFGLGTTSPYAALSVAGASGVVANKFVATSTGNSFKDLTIPGTADGCATFTSGALGSTGTACGGAGGGAYPFPGAGNSTTTLTQFNGGLTAYATSTIGNGTQTTGLTISGGATTTGQLAVLNNLATGAGLGTSTIQNALTINGTNSYLLVSSTTPNYGYLPLDNIDAGGSSNAPETVTVFNNSTSNCSIAAFIAASASAGPFLGNFALLGHSSTNYTGAGCPNEGPLPGADSTLLYEPNGNLVFGVGGGQFKWYTNSGIGGAGSTTPRMILDTNGLLGISSTSPYARLSIHANPTDPTIPTTLFAIGSSTVSATTTLFSVDNTGVTKMAAAEVASTTTTRSGIGLTVGTSTEIAGPVFLDAASSTCNGGTCNVSVISGGANGKGGNVHEYIISSNATFVLNATSTFGTFANHTLFSMAWLHICQDATGGRQVSIKGASIKFYPEVSQSSGTLNIGGAASKCDDVMGYYQPFDPTTATSSWTIATSTEI